jgi:hypothetical protein
MQSNHRAILSPDPAPREVARADGAAEIAAPAIMPAVIRETTAPTLSVAELKEENVLLRSLLHGMAASLCSLAGQIGADLDQAAARARIIADQKRRMS